MRIRSTLLLLAALGSSLVACHKNRDQQPANAAGESSTPVTKMPVREPKADTEVRPKPTPTVPMLKAAPKLSADEQMLDDADATGMTSHAAPSDSEAPDGVANSQP